MGYVDTHLLPGEKLTYQAHLHKIIYVVPALISSLLILPGLILLLGGTMGGLFMILLGSLFLIWAHITYTSSEFAVTNKRIVMKVGWIRRRTLETMLSKVEGIGVDQDMIGRMFDFGTITVTGTGGTKEPFANIARPLEFRRQVQSQVSEREDSQASVHAGSSRPQVPAVAREERDCPYCAERILARATVCKHCGRDVEPSLT